MEKTYKMEHINCEGKVIHKNIPESVFPIYVGMGWKVSEEKKEEPKEEMPSSKPEKKQRFSKRK